MSIKFYYLKGKTQIFSVFFMFLLLWACTPDSNSDSEGDYRDNFIGTWRFTETITKKSTKASETSSYLVVISKDASNSAQVILKNFGNPGTGSTVDGIVTTNQIVVNPQTTSDNWLISGSGTYISAGRMNWNYVITAGGDAVSYTATAEKQ